MEQLQINNNTRTATSKSLCFLRKLKDLLGSDLKLLELFVKQGYQGLIEKREKRIKQQMEARLQQLLQRKINEKKNKKTDDLSQQLISNNSQNFSSSTSETVINQNSSQMQWRSKLKKQDQNLVYQFIEPKLFSRLQEYFGDRKETFLQLQRDIQKILRKEVKKQQLQVKTQLDSELERIKTQILHQKKHKNKGLGRRSSSFR